MAGKKTQTGAAPKTRRAAQTQLVIEGGKRPLGTLVQEAGEAFQPHAALWVDAASGMVVGSQIIDPRQSADQGLGEAVNVLLMALGAKQDGRDHTPGNRRAAEAEVLPYAMHLQALPARVLVSDPALEQVLRTALEPLAVPVERRESLPALEEAFAAITEHLGANPDGSLPTSFSWQVDETLLPRLFKAAAAYERLAPWNYLLDHPPLAIALGEDGPAEGVQTLHVSILGGGGEVFGAACYFDPEGLRTHLREGLPGPADEPRAAALIEDLRRSGAPVDDVPPEMLRTLVANLLRRADTVGAETGGLQPIGDPELPGEMMVDALLLSFEYADEIDPSYAQWLDERGLRDAKRRMIPTFFRSVANAAPQDLDDREVRALTLAIEAVNAFLTQYRGVLRDDILPAEPLTMEARVGTGKAKRTVAVTFPAPGFDWDDDQLPPASPEEVATLYRFQVALNWRKSTWRRIEMRGDQTLEDLHDAIQAAFAWDNDHLYAFFLSGKAWDSATEYGSPDAETERPADQYRLAWLPLAVKQLFLYIFDFGDELRHRIKVEAIIPGGVQADVQYPRITERKGENEPQYPDIDEDQE